jgi:hypothetical protein
LDSKIILNSSSQTTVANSGLVLPHHFRLAACDATAKDPPKLSIEEILSLHTEKMKAMQIKVAKAKKR